MAGDYSIADIATYPWILAALRAQPEQLNTRPNLKRWIDAIATRPAVQKGMSVMADQPQKPLTEEERSILSARSSTNAIDRNRTLRRSVGLSDRCCRRGAAARDFEQRDRRRHRHV